jgi:hypothetical protein
MVDRALDDGVPLLHEDPALVGDQALCLEALAPQDPPGEDRDEKRSEDRRADNDGLHAGQRHMGL